MCSKLCKNDFNPLLLWTHAIATLSFDTSNWERFWRFWLATSYSSYQLTSQLFITTCTCTSCGNTRLHSLIHGSSYAHPTYE